jgi:glutathione S-transferase
MILMLPQLSWQIAGLGPSLGQSVHFLRYTPEAVPYARKRFIAESRRLFNVIEQHLLSHAWHYLVDNKYSIADIACFPWIHAAWFCGIDRNDFPAVKAWHDRIGSRESVQKALREPEPFFASDENIKNREVMETFKTVLQPAVTERVMQETQEWHKAPPSEQ